MDLEVLQHAVVNRICHLFGARAEEVVLDPDASIFDPDAIDPLSLDSIASLEILATLSDELNVAMFDLVDRDGPITYRDLVMFIDQSAAQRDIDAFCGRWAPSGVSVRGDAQRSG